VAKNASVLRVRQIRSRIGQTKKQRAALLTLGLRRIGQVVELPDNAAVRGNVRLIGHLVRVEDEPAKAAPTPAAAPVATKAAAEKPAAEKDAKKVAKKTTKKAAKKTTKKAAKKTAKKTTKKAASDAKPAKKKKTKKKASGGDA